MSEYRPMPLIDFDGIYAAKDPLIAPPNTFETISNGYVHRGRMHKRDGINHKQKLGVSFTDDLHPLATTGITDYTLDIEDAPSAEYAGLEILRPLENYTPGYYSIIIDVELVTEGVMQYVIGPDEDTLTTELYGLGGIQYGVYPITSPAPWPPVSVGTSIGYFNWYCPEKVAELGGTWTFPGKYVSISFPSNTVTQPTVTYERHINYPIVGEASYHFLDGSRYDMIFNTARCWVLDAGEDRYVNEEPSLGDIWTGDYTNHFWCAPFGGILTINNGVDVPYKFDPNGTPTLQAMSTDFDPAAGGNDIDFAEMFVNLNNYGVYINLAENGTAYPGRARWTANGDAETFNSVTDFADAPNNQVAVTAAAVDGEVYVGFRDNSWWKLAVTSDPFAPIEWLPVPSEEGAVAKNGTVPFIDRAVSRSRLGFHSVGRNGQRHEATRLGDIAKKWDPDLAYMTQAVRHEELHQAWFTYATSGDTTPQHVLVMQIEEGEDPQLSTYDLPFHSIGSYATSGTPTWDSVGIPWDQIAYSWDDARNQGGFPIPLGGDMTGTLWAMSGRTTDQTLYPLYYPGSSYATNGILRYSGTPVPFKARSVSLNPYPGQQVRLGRIDIIAEPQPNSVLGFRLVADSSSNAYATKTVSLAPEGSNSERITRSVWVNHIANLSHTIEITEETTAGLTIHALIPWFKPAGPQRGVI